MNDLPALRSRDPLACHDPATGRTVLVAPRRDERPDDDALATEGGPPTTWCPFCAGNESRTPPPVLVAPGATPDAWLARIIPNRYPFVEHAPPESRVLVDSHRPAHGIHDVVIESPRHDSSILTVAADAWQASWSLIQRRLASLASRSDLTWGTVFKNSGPQAGASLAHVHSQLVAIDFVPAALAAELAAAASRADLFADMLAEAAASGRIVSSRGDLVAIVPVAPRQPCETWILPTLREAHFHATSPARVAALAELARDIVGRIAGVLPKSDYNWWLHEAPWHDAGPVADRWHWHLEILPRTTPLAGFELGTGCHVTAWPAAEAAARLRDAL
jgi:UDPglucose--hexose-1-phosphate uridylyltransferase